MGTLSKTQGWFEKTAASADCSESDFLVLKADNITTADEFYFRFADQPKFEDWLKEVVFMKAAFLDEGGRATVFPRPVNDYPGGVQEWIRSSDVAGLRRLYVMSKELVRMDLARMASAKEGEEAVKMSEVVVADMEARLASEGHVGPTNDSERPGLLCLAKAQSVMVSYTYMPWEDYTSRLEEDVARKSGTKAKGLIFEQGQGGGIMLKNVGEEIRLSQVNDLVKFRRSWQFEAIATLC
jgi:hypothetical protein